jgi:hypothetical protein
LARERLNTAPLKFVIFPDEPKICDYISLRALLTILGSVKTRGRVDNYPSTIPSDTLNAIQLEIICLLDLVGQRTGLKRLL